MWWFDIIYIYIHIDQIILKNYPNIMFNYFS